MFRTELFCLSAVVACTTAASAVAEDKDSTVVFEDRFDGMGQLANEWKLNTKEKHQFVLKDGALHVTRNADARHSANLLHKAEFQNGAFEMQFKLVHMDDWFRVQFRDTAFTDVKQGMLFNVNMGEGTLELQDAAVAYGIRQAMQSTKAAKPSSDQQNDLGRTTATVPMKISVDEWHVLLINVQDNTLSVSVDGEVASSLTSATIGHAMKDNFRVEVKPTLVIDSIKVSAMNK